MRSKAGPSYRVLENLADYEKFLSNNDHSIVGQFWLWKKKKNIFIFWFSGYFDSESNSLKQELVKAADKLSEKYRFAYTTSKEILGVAGQTK